MSQTARKNKAAGRNLQGLRTHHVETRHCDQSYCSLLAANIHRTTAWVCVKTHSLTGNHVHFVSLFKLREPNLCVNRNFEHLFSLSFSTHTCSCLGKGLPLKENLYPFTRRSTRSGSLFDHQLKSLVLDRIARLLTVRLIIRPKPTNHICCEMMQKIPAKTLSAVFE